MEYLRITAIVAVIPANVANDHRDEPRCTVIVRVASDDKLLICAGDEIRIGGIHAKPGLIGIDDDKGNRLTLHLFPGELPSDLKEKPWFKWAK